MMFGGYSPTVAGNYPLFSAGISRTRFFNQIAGVVGYSNIKFLHMARLGDTTTSLDLSSNGATITWDATVAGRLTALGHGYQQSFDGATQHGLAPDSAALSFGNGTTDSAFSVVALLNITDSATFRFIIGKRNAGANNEYELNVIDTTDTLRLSLFDQSAGVAATRESNAAIGMGAPHLFAATYSAATGGATAANDITLYQDAAVIASTATNNAGYVAMENTAEALGVYADSSSGTAFFQGKGIMVMLCAGALTLANLAAIKTYVNRFYQLAL